MYNIVTNRKIIDEFKKSKYFKVDLGRAITMVDQANRRKINDTDQFAFNYNSFYKNTLSKMGSVGDISFYLDYYIKEENIIYFYRDKEEFSFQFDKSIITEKGIDFYLGHLLKEIESKYEEKKEAENPTSKQTSNPDVVIKNPGAVTFDDIKSFIEERNKKRYESS